MRLFFHVAAMNSSWYSIYREIYDELVRSKLLENSSKLTIGFIGSTEDFNKITTELVGDKYELLYFGSDFEQYEFPTLNELEKFCKTSDELVMYCHTKGVSNPAHQGKRYWRKAMVKSIITDWERCITLLKTNDLVGYNLHRPRHRGAAPIHFSGNWWWGKPEYIKQCIPILTLQKTPKFISHWMMTQIRFQCEFWLRTGPWLTAKWRSTGVENINREHIIDPIIELDQEVKDPFDFADLQVTLRYVVNMEGQDDRLNSAMLEILRSGIKNVRIFDAIVPETLEGCNLKTKGQLGCYLSNLEIIKEAYTKQVENFLILEDDVEFVHGFQVLFEDCYRDVPKDWDILFVGGYEKNKGPYENIKNKIYKTGDHWGTHCYLLSKTGIEKLYKYLTTNPIEWEIDMLMIHHMPDLIKYSIHPTLAYQKPFKSSTRPKPTENGTYPTSGIL